MKHLYLFMVLGLVFQVPSLLAQCGDTTHTSLASDTWVSCQAATSPNSARGSGHWIKYDFGFIYTLQGMHVWNANELGETDRGFREVIIDYSLDGQSWTELGSYEWSEGSGYNSYVGETGPDFDQVQARYVLITAQSNWGDPSCYGLSEVKFTLDQITNTQLTQSQLGQPLQVFPNPAQDQLNLDLQDLRIQQLRVVDLRGRVMQEFLGDVPLQLDLSELPRGMYFLSAQDEQGQYHSTGFVKE